MAQRNREENSVGSASALEDFRRRKAELEEAASHIRQTMENTYKEALATAARLYAEFSAEFGEAPGLPEGVRSFSVGVPSGNDGRVLGGLKRALTVAQGKAATGDTKAQERVAELSAKIASLSASAASN